MTPPVKKGSNVALLEAAGLSLPSDSTRSSLKYVHDDQHSDAIVSDAWYTNIQIYAIT